MDKGAADEARRALAKASYELANHIDGCFMCWCSEQAHHNPNNDNRPALEVGFCAEGLRLYEEVRASEGAVQLVVLGENGGMLQAGDRMRKVALEWAEEVGVFLSDDPEDRHL